VRYNILVSFSIDNSQRQARLICVVDAFDHPGEKRRGIFATAQAIAVLACLNSQRPRPLTMARLLPRTKHVDRAALP
jgi:hypothetical protein